MSQLPSVRSYVEVHSYNEMDAYVLIINATPPTDSTFLASSLPQPSLLAGSVEELLVEMPLPSPTTKSSSTDKLGITLDDGQLNYRPGDVIRGQVYRKAPAVGPEAVVDVWLCGRSKSELRRGNYQSDTYRGMFTLIDGQRTKQRLFSGPMHIPKDGGPGLMWPFSITIPTHIDSSRSLEEGSKCDSFLNLTKEALKNTPLPASYEKNPPADFNHGVVDYFIQADLRLHAQRSSNCTAKLPIKILRFFPGLPIEDNEPKCKQTRGVICTQRLLPEMHDAQLSNSQKLKKFFGAPSVPRFTFKFQVYYPTMIQIDNPDPISFQLRILPTWDQSSEEIRDKQQQVKLTKLDLSIQTVADIRCQARLSAADDTWRDTTHLAQGQSASSLADMEIPSLEEDPPFDLGAAINLQLPPSDSSSALTPNFTTHTVRVKHFFKYNITCDIAGETFETQDQLPIDILPASEACEGPTRALLRTAAESWMEPPVDENDIPPSFEQAQQESKTVKA